jgi:hypothetical protein
LQAIGVQAWLEYSCWVAGFAATLADRCSYVTDADADDVVVVAVVVVLVADADADLASWKRTKPTP